VTSSVTVLEAAVWAISKVNDKLEKEKI